MDLVSLGLGISRDLLEFAATLHAIFDGKRREIRSQKLTTPAEELRATWEPRILDLDKPIGLGAALAGIAGGAEATAGKENPVFTVTQMDFFTDRLASWKSVFSAERWTKTLPAWRERMLPDWRLAAAAWPPDLRRELAKALVSLEEAE